MIQLYPTLHRPLQQSLSQLALRHLSGNSNGRSDHGILRSSSRLLVALHYTGGKVGAPKLWRQSLDENLKFCWNAFHEVTTTIPYQAKRQEIRPRSEADPTTFIPLNVDRLRCGIHVLCDLLRYAS